MRVGWGRGPGCLRADEGCHHPPFGGVPGQRAQGVEAPTDRLAAQAPRAPEGAQPTPSGTTPTRRAPSHLGCAPQNHITPKP